MALYACCEIQVFSIPFGRMMLYFIFETCSYVVFNLALNFGDTYIIGPVLGTSRLQKVVVSKTEIFDCKWKINQGIYQVPLVL